MRQAAGREPVGPLARAAVLGVLVLVPGLAAGQGAVPAPAPAPAPAPVPVSVADPAGVASGSLPVLPPVPQITVPSTGAVGGVAGPGAAGPGAIPGVPALPGAATTGLPEVPRLTVPVIGPQPAAAPALTPLQQARQLSPGFVVGRDYARLVQCYGTTSYMEAVTRVRAGRPGADPGTRTLVTDLIRLQGSMQPMVLVASEARTERRFRSDYTAVGDRLQGQLRTSRDPEATLQANLRTVIACQRDIARWRGER